MLTLELFEVAARERTGDTPSTADVGAAIIDGFEAVTESQTGTYTALRDAVIKAHAASKEYAPLYFEAVEETYCTQYVTEETILARGARSKSGKLFKTKLLPATYINSRNVLLKALELGVPIDGAGKSELERENARITRERKTLVPASGTLSPGSIARVDVDKLAGKLLGAIPASHRVTVVDEYGAILYILEVPTNPEPAP